MYFCLDFPLFDILYKIPMRFFSQLYSLVVLLLFMFFLLLFATSLAVVRIPDHLGVARVAFSEHFANVVAPSPPQTVRDHSAGLQKQQQWDDPVIHTRNAIICKVCP